MYVLKVYLVCLEDPGDLWDERVVRVGVAQQGADAQQDLEKGETVIVTVVITVVITVFEENNKRRRRKQK